MSAFFSKLFTQFLSKIAKNAILRCKISIAEVGLRLDLVQKSHSSIPELRCASTESKSSLWKLRCASAIKKMKLLLVVEKIVALCRVAFLI